MLVPKKFFFLSFQILNKFIAKSFKAGKRERFELAFYNLLLRASRTSKIPSIFLIFETLERLKPVLGLVPQIRKKKKVFVPVLISAQKKYSYTFQ